ncbi:hypothetical protein KEM56_001994 [Ascosphaera pollenicola]|nr:hypothetical protein KEM56_001994 [Ascosphaera pollenicola]
MPRLVRRQPFLERLKSYLNPLDFLLWLSEELDTRDWELWVKDWAALCVSYMHPNHSSFPLLEPILKPDICPLGSRERWELRSQPLGCNVSTYTFLSMVSAVAGTLAFAALVGLLFWSIKYMVRTCAREIHGVRVIESLPAGYPGYGPAFERPVEWGVRGGPRRVIRRRSMMPGATVDERAPLLV